MLELYSNIKKLRKMKNMSQQELAEAVGYKGKSMIAQIENGTVDLPQSKIMEFAKVFGVDPGELMGWDDEQEDNVTDQFIQMYAKNNEDRALLEMYHNVPPEVRTMVDYLLKSAQPSSEVPHLTNDKEE